MNKWTCPNCETSLTIPSEMAGEFRCVCGFKFQSLTDPGTPGKLRAARGLGDFVAIVAAKLGFKKCGSCEDRQKALNRLGKKA